MDKVRKILVPIDLSPESGQALRDAASLARETWAQLIALHVIDENLERDRLRSSIAPVDGFPFPLDGSPTVPLDVLMRERALDLWNFVEREAEPLSQDRIKKVVRLGKLTREIANFMRDEEVDLLVLKLRRRWLFPDLTTLKLVIVAGRHSCPVWLDPPVARHRPQPKNGLLTFDQLPAARLLSSRPAI
ncbi:MAG: universal stress protein [Candidatus Binatia bacterium]